jgi:hypothetical protein
VGKSRLAELSPPGKTGRRALPALTSMSQTMHRRSTFGFSEQGRSTAFRQHQIWRGKYTLVARS